MNLTPTELALDGDDHLLIGWSDGTRRRYSFRELIEKCPCANCREKRSAASDAPKDDLLGSLPVITSEETQPLKLVKVEPVGSYAYNIIFNQGCQSGIYTLEFLQELGEELPAGQTN